MTQTSRSFAALFAAAFCLMLWVPTLSTPAQAATVAVPLFELA